MSRGRHRVALSPAALSMLRQLAGVRCVPTAAEVVSMLGGDRYWGVLVTLRGRMFVRWDEGGRNVRITRAGREYLAARR